MSRHYSAILFILALGFGFSTTASAQVYPQGDISFMVGFPQGAFNDHVDNLGFGLNLFAGLGIGRSPVVVGADFGFLVYGFERRREPFSTTIPDVTVDVETSNNIFLGHLLLRIQPPRGAVQPYLDGLFGFKYFATETSISDEDFFGDDPIVSSTNFEDAALSYGVGGGVNVEVYRGRGGKKLSALNINAGVRYLFGSEAEYLKEGSIERRDGQVFFTTERSETNMVLTQLGVTFKF
ncbi:MAG: hypothetical protein ACE5G0_12680 [Rhodothermales bacterium]